MNTRMQHLLDQLADREIEEEFSGEVEILPPIRSENVASAPLERPFVIVFATALLPAAAATAEAA